MERLWQPIHKVEALFNDGCRGWCLGVLCAAAMSLSAETMDSHCATAVDGVAACRLAYTATSKPTVRGQA